MPEPFSPARLTFLSIPVRGAAEWTFIELADADGNAGQAEITHAQGSSSVVSRTAELANRLRGVAVPDESTVPVLLGLAEADLTADRTLATAVSGLRSAIAEAQARRAGVQLAELLGGSAAAPVELYANINRLMSAAGVHAGGRSPDSFAAAAARAVASGFRTVKCAPFDECRAPFGSSGLPPETTPGLDRAAAVREAIGPGNRLLVDCHRRFDLESAQALEAELRALNVAWYEEPLDPLRCQDDLRTLRSKADIPLAGGELAYGESSFRALIDHGALDIVMPDVRFCGGSAVAAGIGRSLEGGQAGSVSLHSPSGPLSLLASGHATATFGPAVLPLEHAVYEVEWRAEVLDPPEQVENGSLIMPEGPGLGATLNRALLERRGRVWSE